MNIDLSKKFIAPDGHVMATKLVDFFERDLLNYQRLPDDYLVFLKSIFTNKESIESRNLWKVLHMLTTECLDQQQFEQLSAVLGENYLLYADDMLCDMSCDFIARVCGPVYAFELLQTLAATTKTMNKQQKSGVLTGLSILMTHEEKNSQLYKKAQTLIREVWQ